MKNPLVYVIILAWNGKRWLENCLISVLQTDYANFRVLVVDNGSQDGSVDCVRSKFPEVELLVNRRNLGYAEGNNRGIRLAMKSGADYVALLNQDIKVEPDWLKACIEIFEQHHDIGIISPTQYNYDGTALDENFEKILRKHEKYSADYEKNQIGKLYEVKEVIGAAIVISRKLCEKVGLFDPLYFCYAEEFDLCRRARFHGFKIGIVTDSKVFHWHSLVQERKRDKNQKGKKDKKIYYLMARNGAIYKLKDPFYSFYRNLKSYYWWGGAKDVWYDTNSKITTALIQLWILLHLPQIFHKRYKERKTACYL